MGHRFAIELTKSLPSKNTEQLEGSVLLVVERKPIDDIGKQRMLPIADRYDRVPDGPRDPERRVVPENANLRARVIEIGALVFDLCHPTHDSEPVGEADGQEYLAEVVGGKGTARPTTESRRATSHVERDIEDFTFDDPHQFALRSFDLEVQSPHGVANRSRVIVLDKRGHETVVGISGCVVGLEEEATVVVVNVWFHDQHTVEAGANHAHYRS